MTQTLDNDTTASATDTMQAAVVTEFGAPLSVSEVELPSPGPGEVLVKLESSGVCHTDLHAAHGDWPVKPQLPFIPGHEGYGTVVALGAGVTDLRSATRLATRGCGRRAAAASTAVPAGRRCARASRTAATASTEASAATCWSTPRTRRGSPTTPIRLKSRLSSVPVSPSTRASKSPTPVRASGWRSPASADSATSRCSMPARWAYGWLPSTSTTQTRAGAKPRRGGRRQCQPSDVVAEVQKATGGVHGVLVTAVHPEAFGQAIGLARRGGTIVFNGLPPGDFPAPIFDIVLKG